MIVDIPKTTALEVRIHTNVSENPQKPGQKEILPKNPRIGQRGVDK